MPCLLTWGLARLGRPHCYVVVCGGFGLALPARVGFEGVNPPARHFRRLTEMGNARVLCRDRLGGLIQECGLIQEYGQVA